MRLPLIKYGNIELTTTTIHRVRYHLYLLLLVRLGGNMANLSDFYSYRLIEKLTAFLQIQGFSLHRPTVDSSTTMEETEYASVEDGGENGHSKVVNVGADVLEQVKIGSERENTEDRGVVSYVSILCQDTLCEQNCAV